MTVSAQGRGRPPRFVPFDFFSGLVNVPVRYNPGPGNFRQWPLENKSFHGSKLFQALLAACALVTRDYRSKLHPFSNLFAAKRFALRNRPFDNVNLRFHLRTAFAVVLF